MAAFARLFQLAAALLRLAAVLAMFAFCLAQLLFGLADALFAPVTLGLRRNCSGRKERNQECGGEQLASKLHVPLLGLSRDRPLGEPIGMRTPEANESSGKKRRPGERFRPIRSAADSALYNKELSSWH